MLVVTPEDGGVPERAVEPGAGGLPVGAQAMTLASIGS